jgi:DNA replication protein DnaC
MNNPQPQHLLIYIGSSGIGKSYFCSALEEWIFKTFDFDVYFKESELLQRLRDGIAEGKQDYRKNLMSLIDHQMVVLDDVGSWYNPTIPSSKEREWKIEIFYEFLEERTSSCLPTVITSNLSEEDFYKVYASRVHSRLFSVNNTIIKDFESVDKRLTGF